MKTTLRKKHQGGYISLLAVITVSVLMLALMVFAYERAISAREVQAEIQVGADYREKEEATLRSIVAILPNRAIRAMQDGSDASAAARAPLRFDNIFREALSEANAAESISPQVLEAMNLGTTFSGNSGDTTFANIGRVFRRLSGDNGNVSAGVGQDLGQGFPPALDYTNGPLAFDSIYPLITSRKIYGAQADGKVGLPTSTYQDFNLIPYPDINFGYSTPGQPFVAKRNWWAFTMDLAGQDDAANDGGLTNVGGDPRTYVLSLYEIPSQLPISASSFMALGQHEDGSAWQDVQITGNVFAGRALVEGETALPGLASRRGFELSSNTTLGGKTFAGNPFTPGVRENIQLGLAEGEFFPVSLASESGKAAFVPINRGESYFDRFSHNQNETVTLSPTTWNNYSVGAMECAMQLDIVAADSVDDPSRLRLRYFEGGVRREIFKDFGRDWTLPNLPPLGYVDVGDENSQVTFTTPHDLAYGRDGAFNYIDNFTGTIRFNNFRFGDPLVGVRKRGFARPTDPNRTEVSPFDFDELPSGEKCVSVKPQRIPEFLSLLGGDGTDVNHSLVVNVDYIANNTLSNYKDRNWGVILEEGADMTPFPRGFSMVTNLTLYIGDDFNVVTTTPPEGYNPPGGDFFPPCSLFAPEKRFGVDFDPFGVELSGQIGSVAQDDAESPVRPLDATGVTGKVFDTSKMKVNLSAINHPAELPPITMKNWLIVIEELRSEFLTASEQ